MPPQGFSPFPPPPSPPPPFGSLCSQPRGLQPPTEPKKVICQFRAWPCISTTYPEELQRSPHKEKKKYLEGKTTCTDKVHEITTDRVPLPRRIPPTYTLQRAHQSHHTRTEEPKQPAGLRLRFRPPTLTSKRVIY